MQFCIFGINDTSFYLVLDDHTHALYARVSTCVSSYNFVYALNHSASLYLFGSSLVNLRYSACSHPKQEYKCLTILYGSGAVLIQPDKFSEEAFHLQWRSARHSVLRLLS